MITKMDKHIYPSCKFYQEVAYDKEVILLRH